MFICSKIVPDDSHWKLMKVTFGFLKAMYTPTPWPSLLPLPLFKIFVFHPLFSVPPPVKVFQAVPSSLHNSLLHKLTNQPSLHIISRFEQISNGWFYQFNCCFLSKINFWFFKSLIRLSWFMGYFQVNF